jgi:hypothetical protein
MAFLNLSLINLGILLHYKPYNDISANRIEVLNEGTIYLCNTCVYCIVNDGTNDDFRQYMGDHLM